MIFLQDIRTVEEKVDVIVNFLCVVSASGICILIYIMELIAKASEIGKFYVLVKYSRYLKFRTLEDYFLYLLQVFVTFWNVNYKRHIGLLFALCK